MLMGVKDREPPRSVLVPRPDDGFFIRLQDYSELVEYYNMTPESYVHVWNTSSTSWSVDRAITDDLWVYKMPSVLIRFPDVKM